MPILTTGQSCFFSILPIFCILLLKTRWYRLESEGDYFNYRFLWPILLRELHFFVAVSISPIYTAAFSTIPINRGIYSDRPFGGTADEVRNVKNAPVNPVEAASRQTTQGINPTESASKSVERRQGYSQSYPEKSTDSEKKTPSGDILDLSDQSKPKSLEKAEKAESPSKAPGNLTAEEQAQVEKLKARDAEVKNHEAAHLAAAGQYAKGGPKYVYQTGPDGKQYAIGGSVSIDVSPVSGNPQATLQKAQQVRSAALAPAEPSGQDQKVAAAASQMEAEARLQLAREKAEKATNDSDSQTSDTYGPFGSLVIDKEFGNNDKNASQESSFVSALSSRRNGGNVTSAYQQVQAQTSPLRAFAAYA